jgi:hypothetical protein
MLRIFCRNMFFPVIENLFVARDKCDIFDFLLFETISDFIVGFWA